MEKVMKKFLVCLILVGMTLGMCSCSFRTCKKGMIIDKAMDYIQKSYPDEKFKVTGFENNWMKEHYTVNIKSADDIDEFKVRLDDNTLEVTYQGYYALKTADELSNFFSNAVPDRDDILVKAYVYDNGGSYILDNPNSSINDLFSEPTVKYSVQVFCENRLGGGITSVDKSNISNKLSSLYGKGIKGDILVEYYSVDSLYNFKVRKIIYSPYDITENIEYLGNSLISKGISDNINLKG